MSLPLAPEQDEDLHLLMAIAVLSGRKGVFGAFLPIYQLWSDVYPADALGGIGLGLNLIAMGDAEGGFALIEETARSAETRADQAKAIMETLRRDHPVLGQPEG